MLDPFCQDEESHLEDKAVILKRVDHKELWRHNQNCDFFKKMLVFPSFLYIFSLIQANQTL